MLSVVDLIKYTQVLLGRLHLRDESSALGEDSVCQEGPKRLAAARPTKSDIVN